MIADIETQRQAMEKEAGVAAACGSALRKLHEFRPAAGHPENVGAVTTEIERVKLAAGKIQNPFPGNRRNGQRRLTWRNAHRSPPRNKGRRTMGRGGGR